jgi:hypothetical protein
MAHPTERRCRSFALIPRYQRVLFWSLVAGILLMLAFLLRGCQQAHRRLAALSDATPITAPTTASTEDITLYVANDNDGSITAITKPLALAQEPTIRARALLEQLLALYALPNSTHPLQGGPTVDDVFLINSSSFSPSVPSVDRSETSQTDQMAVVNLRGSFADSHPSGIVVEALTLQSIIGTLHAALPQITTVRFLVDGQPRETLAGHADLLRTYPVTDTSGRPAPPADSSQQ